MGNVYRWACCGPFMKDVWDKVLVVAVVILAVWFDVFIIGWVLGWFDEPF